MLYPSLLVLFLLSACTNIHTPYNHQVSEGEATAPVTRAHSEVGFYYGLLDSNGNLWFSTRGKGVFIYNDAGFVNLTAADGLCDNDITCIAEDRAGNIWFGTTNGLCRFDGQSFSHLAIPQSDTSSLWLDKVYPVVNPNQVMSVLEDRNGDLWIGTNGAGVYRYDGQHFTQYLSDIGMVYEDGQYHNIVLSIIEDLEGDLWFSSLSHGGVSRYDGNTFTHFVENLSDDFIRVVFCDSKGIIWIGTHGNHKGGLDRLEGNTITAFYKTDDGFPHNNVCWIYEDPKGFFWMGSGTSDLSHFDGNTFKPFRANDGQTFHNIHFVVGDSTENIWFGGREGLWRYDGKDVMVMSN